MLTPFHHRIMKYRLNGVTNFAIARAFGITEKAIEYHFKRIRQELGAVAHPNQRGSQALLVDKYYEYRKLKNLPPLH